MPYRRRRQKQKMGSVLLVTFQFSNKGNQCVLICQEPTEEDEFPLLRQEVEPAIKPLNAERQLELIMFPPNSQHAADNQWSMFSTPSATRYGIRESGVQYGQNRSSSPSLRRATIGCIMGNRGKSATSTGTSFTLTPYKVYTKRNEFNELLENCFT